ncbi:alpha/beta fold hydrolase [Kitasatospora griseola]|uniref:alpha/beta fold hydrolase n=1 Tax=Kitasatospora griseola TaxID=2064 RepID=UPI0036D9485C
MPLARVNGVGLYYELAGDGDPLVLVHGSWSDHLTWGSVVPDLAERYRVLVYDRRGHSRSERPEGQGARTEDEQDLAALIETFDLAPAHVAGNSFGASTALGLAARRPELFRSLAAHEPPLMGIVAEDPDLRPLMRAMGEKLESVCAHLRAGEDLAGAEQFVDEVALGPGNWEQLPDWLRDALVTNAPTFLDELADPDWLFLDLARLPDYTGPALLTNGTESPPWFPAIISRLGEALPRAEVRELAGAGHVPHVSHPEDYVRSLTGFLDAA